MACELLDHEYSKDDIPRVDQRDRNIYTFGRIYGHNVVIACLPEGRYGTNSAAVASERMRMSFPEIQFGLLVGIAGGAPSPNSGHDIRLGDVVVCSPTGRYGGVLQYDHGKAVQYHEFEESGTLPPPPELLLNAMSRLKSIHKRKGHRIQKTIQAMLARNGRLRDDYGRPDTMSDQLYESTYIHDSQNICHCSSHPEASSFVIPRTQRDSKSDDPAVHYGLIASANTVMKDAIARDALVAKHDVLCFEMEAAGVMNTFPCVVIRGICDYSDTHKNDAWQGYAAATATAYAMELLEIIPGAEVQRMQSGSTDRVAQFATEQINAMPLGLQSETSMETSSQPDASFKYTSDLPLVTTKSHYLIPPRNGRFVGREDKLRLLESRLFVEADCQQCSIVGLGGVGKTQLALAFCHTIKKNYPDYSIFWLSGLSHARFKQDYATIAKACSIGKSEKDDILPHVKEYLSSEAAGKWLLVLDNIDDKTLLFDNEDGLANNLPQSENGKLLFTTRYKDIAVDIAGSGNILDLEVMTIDESELFLKKSLGRGDLIHDKRIIRELLEELEYLPLAIAQASSYIIKTSISLWEYLSLLKSSEADMISLLSHDFRDNTRDKESRSAVAVTWLVSFQQMQKEEPAAADILFFIALIENKKIPMSILPQPAHGNLLHAIGTLMGYSFLTRQGNEDDYDMHRLVHRTVRLWMRKEGILDEWTDRVLIHLAKMFPWDDWKHRNIWREYVPHTVRILQDTKNIPSDYRADICIRLGCCLSLDGRFSEALLWISECATWRNAFLPKNDKKRLDAQHELAVAYKDTNQSRKAIVLLEEVIAIETNWFASDHLSKLASQHVLAMAYFDDDQRERAINLLEKIVEEKTARLAENDPNRLASQHELARAYSRDGKTTKAIQLLEQIVKVKAAQLTKNDPSILVSQHELATAYRTNGNTEKAIELLEQVVEVQAHELAENNPSRLLSEHELASAYLKNGETKRAIDLLKHVVHVQCNELSPSDPTSLASQHELGRAYRRDGQTEQAIQVLQQVVEAKGELAENDPSKLVSQQVLARAFEDADQMENAVDLISHVVDACQTFFAPNHPDRLLYEADLSRMQKRLERRQAQLDPNNWSADVITIDDSDDARERMVE